MFGRATIMLGIGPHCSLVCMRWYEVVVIQSKFLFRLFMAALQCIADAVLRTLYFPHMVSYFFFMVALCNRADHYIFALLFLLSSFFLA